MMRIRPLFLVASLMATGCHVYLQDPNWPPPVYESDPSQRPPPPGTPAPRPPPPGTPAPPQQPPPLPPQNVLRAKEIKAGRVSARVIYAKEVKARDGQVGRIYRVEGNEDWGGNEIRVPEISADVIYAKEIHADWVEASEIHAKEVKIGR
jgi:hypothetical protein